MIILARRNFSSRIQDEDYINEQKKRKKDVRHAKRDGAIFLGAGGALMGSGVGLALKESAKHGAIGAAIGGTAGALAGRYLGKKHKEETEKDADRKISRYQRASSKEKDYLLQKERYDKEIAMRKQQADAMTAMAINSMRW